MFSYIVNVTSGIVVPICLTQAGELFFSVIVFNRVTYIASPDSGSLGGQGSAFLTSIVVDSLCTLPQERP